MDKLINEISTIVRRYGKSIVTGNRFVNILKDLYPDRDNPEKFKIIYDLISQDTIARLLKVKKEDLESFVEKQSSQYSKTNKVDKEDVSAILFAFAVGTKCITRSEYNSYKKPVKPNNPNNPVPNKPSPVQRQYDYRFNEIFTLILAFVGLCATPFVYLGLLSNHWWPFWAIVAVAVLHFFTIVPGAIVINGFNESLKKQNPVMVGSYCTIAVCGALFLAFAPFIIDWTYNWFVLEHNHWFGFTYYIEYSWANDDKLILGYESPTILTLFLGIICASVEISLAAINDGVTKLTAIQIYKKDSRGFLKGVAIASFAIAVVTVVCFLIPHISNYNRKQKMQEELEKYNTELLQIDKLRQSRASQTMDFTFKDFFMGQSLEQCSAIIHDTSQYIERNNPSLSSNELMIDSICYNEVVDTLLSATTEWDNKDATLFLYFNEKKLIGIRFAVNQEIDSLVSIYSKKYGEPEHFPLNPKSQSLEAIAVDRETTYTWTYKNGTIQIRDVFYNCWVTYLDRSAVSVFSKIQNEKEAERQRQLKEAEEAKKRADEIERQRVLEEQKRQESNHKKAINEI